MSGAAAPTATPDPGAALVALEGVSRVYGQGESEVRALDDVDLRIDQGEFVAIMGQSGSGKSTCMNILGALRKAMATTGYSDLKEFQRVEMVVTA